MFDINDEKSFPVKPQIPIGQSLTIEAAIDNRTTSSTYNSVGLRNAIILYVIWERVNLNAFTLLSASPF